MISKFRNATAGSRKMLIGLGAVVVLAVAYSFLSTPEPQVNPSTVQAPPQSGPTIQGGNPVSQAYDEALSQADSQRIDTARETGKSAIPTIRANTSEQVIPVIEVDPPAEEPPVVELPEVKAPVVVQQPLAPVVPIVQQPGPMQNPAQTERLMDYMGKLRRGNPVAEVITLSSGELPQAAQAEQSAPLTPEAPATGGDAPSKIKLPLPGTVLYAEMVSRANSDAPGPVLARILQGEYQGATLLGSFETVQNALVIKFDKMTVATTRDGEEINETVPIQTVAVDTTHIGTALATKVDRHLFQKLAIGFTAGFAQGFGDALARSGTTRVITDSGTQWETSDELDTDEQLLSAGGKAVANSGEILMEEFGRRPTTVIVESGTLIGVLFL